MPRSAASTPADYLAEQPPERRAALQAVLDVVRANLPRGYSESMAYGMITWSIPLARYPNTYNKQPLGYVCLASGKGYCSLHLPALYTDPTAHAWFVEAYAASGKKLDMGKGCVRFRRAEDLPLDVVAQAVARATPDEYIAMYERARASR